MDIVGLIKKSYQGYGSLISDSWYALLKENVKNNVSFAICFESHNFPYVIWIFYLLRLI